MTPIYSGVLNVSLTRLKFFFYSFNNLFEASASLVTLLLDTYIVNFEDWTINLTINFGLQCRVRIIHADNFEENFILQNCVDIILLGRYR